MKIQIDFIIDSIYYKKYQNALEDFLSVIHELTIDDNANVVEKSCNIHKYNLENIYLDYVNNYLTVEKMANDLDIKKDDLEKILTIGKKINNNEY